jgi:hypothetical protein
MVKETKGEKQSYTSKRKSINLVSALSVGNTGLAETVLESNVSVDYFDLPPCAPDTLGEVSATMERYTTLSKLDLYEARLLSN